MFDFKVTKDICWWERIQSHFSQKERKQSFKWTGNVKKETITKEIDNLLQNIISDQIMDL